MKNYFFLFKLKIYLNATAVCIHSCYALCMNLAFTAIKLWNKYVCLYTHAETMIKIFPIFLCQKDVDIVNLAWKLLSLTCLTMILAQDNVLKLWHPQDDQKVSAHGHFRKRNSHLTLSSYRSQDVNENPVVFYSVWIWIHWDIAYRSLCKDLRLNSIHCMFTFHGVLDQDKITEVWGTLQSVPLFITFLY